MSWSLSVLIVPSSHSLHCSCTLYFIPVRLGLPPLRKVLASVILSSLGLTVYSLQLSSHLSLTKEPVRRATSIESCEVDQSETVIDLSSIDRSAVLHLSQLQQICQSTLLQQPLKYLVWHSSTSTDSKILLVSPASSNAKITVVPRTWSPLYNSGHGESLVSPSGARNVTVKIYDVRDSPKFRDTSLEGEFIAGVLNLSGSRQ